MATKKSIHFIGIGGIGMSALARYFKAQNWAVSGSDLTPSGITQELKKEVVKVKIGHKKGHIKTGLDLVVYSQAIRPDNSELREAQRHKIPALSYPEAVGELTEKYRTIAIAGAHGKSTTTALASLILIKAGLDPTVIIGTNLKEFGGKNFRSGKSGPLGKLGASWLVLEADEYGKAFLRYSPTITIITNIDREHLDTYKNLANVKNAFLKFLSGTRTGGTIILNRDNKNIFSLKSKVQKLAREKKLNLGWYSLSDPVSKIIKRVIKIPGEHNMQNALAAYKLSQVLKIPEKKILAAIGSYRGAWRRMEYRGRLHLSNVNGQLSNVLVYDDYAHHPTEIMATLVAFREKFPKSKIVCVFQPHQAKRLAALFKEFQHAFDLADITLILPLYKVTGRDEKITRDSEALVRAIQKRESKKLIFYLKDPRKLKSALNTLLVSGQMSMVNGQMSAVLVMMGAGNIVNYTDLLLK